MMANPAYFESDTATFGNFREATRQQFSRVKSIVRARVEFGTREQGTSESIDEYITVLRSMAPDCRFGGTFSENLAI